MVDEQDMEFGEEILDDSNILRYREAAEYLDLSFESFKTIANRAAHTTPLPFIKVRIGKRIIKFFRKSALDEWDVERKTDNQRKWPPTERQLIAMTPSSMPTPKAKYFPDHGTPIPPYTNLIGRTVRPDWITCLQTTCTTRFISPDQTTIRYCDCCRNHIIDDRVMAI